MRVARHARTVEYPPGERFASMDDVGRRRVAVATILHLPEREAGKSRYGVNVEALRCVARSRTAPRAVCSGDAVVEVFIVLAGRVWTREDVAS